MKSNLNLNSTNKNPELTNKTKLGTKGTKYKTGRDDLHVSAKIIQSMNTPFSEVGFTLDL